MKTVLGTLYMECDILMTQREALTHGIDHPSVQKAERPCEQVVGILERIAPTTAAVKAR
jgi:hypothetical protein